MDAVVSAAAEFPVTAVTASAYRVPTDAPESDGALAWDATTLVVAEVSAGGATGLGYGYADAAAARLVAETLAPVLQGGDALAIPACHQAMRRALRNDGHGGLAAMAVSALDAALWDLKGRLLGLPLASLLGASRAAVPAYGSGGFTSYDDRALARQLGAWAEEGVERVKMKIGRDPASDPRRLEMAREAIGPEVALMVDANGALDRKEALALALRLPAFGVVWFEEPVSSEDLEGLRLLRDRAPAPVEIAAGEYGFTPGYFRRMAEAGAVDVLQADATRCGGITGFLAVDALCQAFELPLSAHCAPALRCHPACAAVRLRDLEAFHDHLRIEALLFDGAPRPRKGRLAPDLSRPGLGLELKRADAARYAL